MTRIARAMWVAWMATGYTACVTSDIRIDSNPTASEVFAIGPNGNEQRIGETPLSVNSQTLFRSGDVVKISIRKPGYNPQAIYLPKTIMASSGEVSMTLTEKKEIEKEAQEKNIQEITSCEDFSRNSINKVSRLVAATQAFIMRGDYPTAEVRVSSMLTEYPSIPVLYDLLGNINYLQKKYARALEAYEKSLRLQADNVETAFMVKKLREITGKNP